MRDDLYYLNDTTMLTETGVAGVIPVHHGLEQDVSGVVSPSSGG